MKPKKQSSLDLIIAGIALIAVIFFSLNVGMALTDKAAQETAQGITKQSAETINLFFNCLNDRLTYHPIEIAWNNNVKQSLMWGCFIWFISVAYWFTSKKNYITGKEYGTAKWGTQKDISDLFAITIMNKEIKQARQVRTRLGRYFAKKKVYATCNKNSAEIKNARIARVRQWEEDNKPEGKKLNQEQKTAAKEIALEAAKKIDAIEKEESEKLKNTLVEAWKPNEIEKQYQNDLAEIKAERQKGITITSNEEERRAIREAENRKNTSLQVFYTSKGRIAAINKKYENADALFTKTERISIYNYVLNNNTLILGGAGSGKTRGFVMPNVLQAHSSLVLTDPKGEILEKAGYFLEKVKGFKLRVLNLDNKQRSDGYNPFVYIHPEREGYEERVLSLIEAIIINTDGGEKKTGSDPFWDKAERLFLQAVFFFTCDGFPIEERNMNTVLSLIAKLKIEEENDNRDSDLDYFARIFEENLNAADTLHHNAGTMNIGVQQYKEFREKASGKTAKSIVISAVARLAPFRTSAVRRIFSYDTMHLDRLGEELTAIFVVVPPTDTTFNFIAGMLFTQMFQELQYCATQVHKHDGQRLPIPVRFILDEFANTCTIPQFVKILAYARSFGIGIVPVLQSLEQIKNMYKDEWGVIVDNCNTLLYLGSITHMDTLEYMSKLLGKGTFDKRTTGRTRGRSGSSSQNFDVIGRDLMDTAEIRKLPKENCLLVVGGRNPFYSDKYDYTSHPNYKFTSDANKAYSYEYEPPEPPTSKKEKEIERTHREDEMKARVTAHANKIMERVNEGADEIQMSFDIKGLLNRAGQAFPHLAPIADSVLAVNDGELPEDKANLLLNALDNDELDNEVDRLLAVEQTVKNIKDKIEGEVRKNEYRLETDVTEVAKAAVQMVSCAVPISDNLLNVNDGTVENLPNADGFTLDEDGEEEIAQDDIGDLSSELNGILSEFTELQITAPDATA
ncbi:hypothetical protein OBV_p-00330 (plasmid) [Oscillibacter valericigenes Sjm18-20]|nr:hypothetical protein OBV_p-00330 [Oscillibacter valericigenes Sjm18-20]